MSKILHPPSSSSSFTTFTESHPQNQTLTLIPGLPYDLAALILAFLPYPYHQKLKSICKSWKHFFSSRFSHSIRHKHIPISKLSHLLCIFPQDPSVSTPYIFDPQNLAWCNLPLMPCNPHVYGLCNFASVAHNSHIYVLGGSLFDTRSFPLDRPSPSRSSYRYDFIDQNWVCLPPMLSPRGSFACGSIPNADRIIVAGGGSRHTMFGAAGSRTSSVEMYDIGRNKWVALAGLPRFRAGCVGFMAGNGDGENEFWVMGGYGESRTILGVFPVDEYYRDAVVMRFDGDGGGKWRTVGDMWEEGERRQLGKIAVVEDVNGGFPEVFMLDKNDIFRVIIFNTRHFRIKPQTTAALINQHGVNWDQAVSMLNDEVLRLEAQKGSQSTVLAATSTQTAPHTNQPGHPSEHNNSYNRGRGRGRGSWNRRGGRGRHNSQRQSFSPWSGQQQQQPGYSPQPNFPQWAWWSPPPCPYPTQQQWRPNNSPLQPQQQPEAQSQAHFSGIPQQQFSGYSPSPPSVYNALSPSDLSAAFSTMQLNQPSSSWASDLMDTGAESHVTHEQGSQN